MPPRTHRLAWPIAFGSAFLLGACQTSKPPEDPGSLLSDTPTAAGASSCPPLADDWLSAMPAQQRRIAPADCSQHRGTPLFAWGDARDRNAAQPYSLVVRQAGGSPVHSQADLREPRARLPKPLPPGNYEWTVGYSAAAGGLQLAQWRRFSIDASDGQTQPHDLVEGSQVAALVTARARPRVLAAGMSFERLRALALQPESLPALNLLRSRAAAAQQGAVPASPPPLGGASPLAQSQALSQLVQTALGERLNLEALSLVARLDNNAAMLAAAKRRLLALAAWPAGGSTGEAAASPANAELSQALAYGLDLLWNDLSAAERAQIVAPLRERLTQGSTATFAQLDREPHAAAGLLRLRAHTQALLLASGSFPEAQSLLARAWELNRHSLQHWGTDGNQGPAIAQAWQQFAAGTQFAAAVRTIAGIDLYELPALRRSAEQLMAFTAPGAEQPAAFGDAAETRDLYERHIAALRLHAQQSRDVSAIWYWQARPANVSRPADASVWQLLLLGASPQPLPTGSTTVANDWFSTQAGLAAMHSDIRSASRSSVYFISSRHGAYGAAQAEQNALVYVSQGHPLLVNAGSTPYAGSPHHRNTRATRFKNALTFDGGIGQAEGNAGATRPGDPLFNMDPSGSLIRAQSVGPYAAVTGDATAAYRAVDTARNTWTPLLSNAVRSVVVDKANGLTLVYDWATSATPRQWELNFHAPNAFISDAATVRSVNGPASVCLDRHGPATQFSQTAGWEVAPELPQAAPARGRFSTLVRSPEFAHLTVLREGCRNVPLQVSQRGTQINILINGKDTLQFDRREISLPARASAASLVPIVALAATAAGMAARADTTGSAPPPLAAALPSAAPSGVASIDAADVLATPAPATALRKAAVTASVDSSSSFASHKWLWSLECAGKVMGALAVENSGLFGPSYGGNQQVLRFGKVPDPLEPARQVLMFRAHRDDVLIAGAPRCELTFSPTQSGRLPVGRDFWFGFGVHLPGWINTADEQIIAQWHQGDGSTPLSPFFAVSVLGDTLRIVARQNGNALVSKATTVMPVDYRIKSLPKDRWHYFVVQARVSHDPTAKPFLRVWRNGTNVINYSGPFGYNLSNHAPFAKIGHYHWNDSSNRWPVQVPIRTVLFRSPMLTLDETSRYTPEDVRGYVMRN